MAVATFVLGVAAAPVEEVVEFAAPLVVERDMAPISKRADFQFRFYSNGGCDHNSNPSQTWPSNGTPPGQGSAGVCYSAPTGVNWDRVEIDQLFGNGGGRGLQTFCNINCQGGASVKQQGTNCYLPIGGCAIGSFAVIG